MGHLTLNKPQRNWNIPYNLIFTTKFNDSSILITIISCDYLNLSLADESVGDVTIPTQVIEYNQNFLQVDQPIRLKYSNQIKLLHNVYYNQTTQSDKTFVMLFSKCKKNVNRIWGIYEVSYNGFLIHGKYTFCTFCKFFISVK